MQIHVRLKIRRTAPPLDFLLLSGGARAVGHVTHRSLRPFFLLRGFALLERVVMDVAGGVDTDVAHLWMSFSWTSLFANKVVPGPLARSRAWLQRHLQGQS